jgi:hypothetical protein
MMHLAAAPQQPDVFGLVLWLEYEREYCDRVAE